MRTNPFPFYSYDKASDFGIWTISAKEEDSPQEIGKETEKENKRRLGGERRMEEEEEKKKEREEKRKEE